MDSVFEQFRGQAWPYKFNGTLHVRAIAGGTPTDPKVIEGHLRSKLGTSDDLIREEVAKVMTERGVTADEAVALVGSAKHLNGFRRDQHGLYIEGRQLKAALKEAANVAVAAGKLNQRGWGVTNKGLLGFLAEHIVVDDDRIYLTRDGESVLEHDEIVQRFVHTWRGTGIQYEEICHEVDLNFTVLSDWAFTDTEWAMIWLTGEEQGIGASRSQSFGKYRIVNWDRVEVGKAGAKVTGSSKKPAARRKTAASA
ncbi:MAG: hypothetical protein WC054_00345 [Candidatus Nanopelagicales bacterium]